jgi:hypothetical protein
LTRGKEKIGDFKNSGREWQPRGKPEEVRVYDFVDSKLGKVTPYGVYDVIANEGWVSVGINHDTADPRVKPEGKICGGKHPALVEGNGTSPLSRSTTVADYGRLRWQQWVPCPLMARSIAKIC